MPNRLLAEGGDAAGASHYPRGMRAPAALSALVDRAEALLPAPGRVVLGITGAPGAGKSTLAETLVAGLRADLGPDDVGPLGPAQPVGGVPEEQPDEQDRHHPR